MDKDSMSMSDSVTESEISRYSDVASSSWQETWDGNSRPDSPLLEGEESVELESVAGSVRGSGAGSGSVVLVSGPESEASGGTRGPTPNEDSLNASVQNLGLDGNAEVEALDKEEEQDAESSMRFRPGGITTFGEAVVEHEVTIRKEARELENMERSISEYLTDGAPRNSFESKQFVVAHFNYYCADSTINPKYLLPSEFSLRCFSLDEGLLRFQVAYGLIDPGVIPPGMRAEAMEAAEQFKIPMIGKSAAALAAFPDVASASSGPSNSAPIIYSPKQAFEAFDKMAQMTASQITEQKWIFVMRDHMSVADRCLKYLKLQSSNGETDNHGFRLAPLTVLALEIKKLCKHTAGPRIPNITNEGHAERILEHPQYAYNAEIGCRWHAMYENEDAVDKCSNNIVSRMIYNLLGYIRVTQSIKVYPPHFAPQLQKIDVVDRKAMEEINKRMELMAREEREQEQGPWRKGGTGSGPEQNPM